ncbi:MAG: hypothetical protein AAF608_12970 [Pseudomonadota bacterium]
MKQLICAVSVAAVLSGAASASELTFEGLGGEGTPIDTVVVDGVTIDISVSSSTSFDQAILYDTASPVGEDPDLEAPFFNTATGETETADMVGNILIISENDDSDGDGSFDPADDLGSGGTFTFEFSVLSTVFSMDVLDSKKTTFKFFDENGDQIGGNVVVGSVDTIDTEFPNEMTTVVFGDAGVGISGVKSFTVKLKESGGLDDLSFEAIPVPGALPLMIGGAALLGAAGRRRRQR